MRLPASHAGTTDLGRGSLVAFHPEAWRAAEAAQLLQALKVCCHPRSTGRGAIKPQTVFASSTCCCVNTPAACRSLRQRDILHSAQ